MTAILVYVLSLGNPDAFFAVLPILVVVGVLFGVLNTYIMTPFSLRSHAKPLTDAPGNLIALVQDISKTSGLPKAPALYVIETPELNAMAYYSINGPRVAFTSGILNAYDQGTLSDKEMGSIIGHELGHVKERHSLKESFVLSTISIFNFFGTILMALGAGALAVGMATSGSKKGGSAGAALLGLALLVMGLILKAVVKIISAFSFLYSRSLELRADTFSKEVVGDPDALISALHKMESVNAQLTQEKTVALPNYDGWNTKPVRASWVDRVFDTHPKLDRRIENLNRPFTAKISAAIPLPSSTGTHLPLPGSPLSSVSSMAGDRYCRHCGSKVRRSATYCPSCGTKI